MAYTRGLPDSGPVPDVSLEAVDRFHADLDAEARLRLLEAFDTHVRGEDWAAIASAAGSSSPTIASAHQRIA